MTTLVDDLVPDELWALVEPLLPAPPRPPCGGRRRAIPDRNCFAAIVYMARTSTRYRWRVERSLSWLSCWRRLQVRWDRDVGRWFAFVLLACAVVGFNRLSARFRTRA